jgi:hypothetical protein
MLPDGDQTRDRWSALPFPASPARQVVALAEREADLMAAAASPDSSRPCTPSTAVRDESRKTRGDVAIVPGEQARIIAEAFQHMYVLEKTCQTQVTAQSGGTLGTPTADSIAAVDPHLESFGDDAGPT